MIYWTFSGDEIRITCGDDFGEFIKRMVLSKEEWADFYKAVQEINDDVQLNMNTEFTHGIGNEP